MDNNKFEEFVKQNTRIVRRGETLTRKVAYRAKKIDPDNMRLASVHVGQCGDCQRQVTNHTVVIVKKWTAYRGDPYWTKKCLNCKKNFKIS